MKLNYDDDEKKKPLKGNALNETKQDQDSTVHQDEDNGGGGDGGGMSDETRRKYIKYGIFGGIGLIILILAIVLPLTLGGKKKDPVKPLVIQNQNPYFEVEGKF